MDYADRYGRWWGNPQGTAPDRGRCAEEVIPRHEASYSYQCSRRPTHDTDENGKPTTCWQHRENVHDGPVAP